MVEYISHDQLVVRCNITFEKIEQFSMKEQYSEHGQAELVAQLTDGSFNEIKTELNGQPIQIYASRNEAEILLFHGTICTVQILAETKYLTIKIFCRSVSWLMDLERKCRSFQDRNETILSMIEKIATEHDFCVITPAVDQKMNCPVIQYEETDWEFIKRLSTHLSAPVLAASHYQRRGISIGDSEAPRSEALKAQTEKWCMEMGQIHFASVKTERSTYYEVLTGQIYHIGDCVIYKNQTYWVHQTELTLRHGQLQCVYQLTAKEYCQPLVQWNQCLKGITLSGTVLERKGERIKIHLDIDEEQSVETAYWYLWLPEHGNMLYCMPESGTKVHLLIPNQDEREAIAINCIRQNGGTCKQTHNPSSRWFATTTGKRMALQPNHLELLASSDESNILIEDGFGERITSHKEIIIKGSGNVMIRGERVLLQAPKELSVVKRQLAAPTVLNICHNVDAVGAKSKFVNAKGSSIKKQLGTFSNQKIRDLTVIEREEMFRKEKEKIEFNLKELADQNKETKSYQLGASILNVISAIPQKQETDVLLQMAVGFRPIAGKMKED